MWELGGATCRGIHLVLRFLFCKGPAQPHSALETIVVGDLFCCVIFEGTFGKNIYNATNRDAAITEL